MGPPLQGESGMSGPQGRSLELTFWPPLLDIQEVWEPEELKPPPDEELMLPDGRELDAPCRVEPDPEE